MITVHLEEGILSRFKFAWPSFTGIALTRGGSFGILLPAIIIDLCQSLIFGQNFLHTALPWAAVLVFSFLLLIKLTELPLLI